ncbi:uncharacterized protein LOC144124459 [Amblyomma americanum]
MGADITVLTETWLNESVRNSEIFSSQKCYHIFRCDRPSGRGGGTLIAVSEDIACFEVNLDTTLEFICVQIKINNKALLFCACYRPPSTTVGFCNYLHDILNIIQTRFPNRPIFLFGDFNFPAINWSDTHLGNDGSSESTSFFSALCSTFSLTQVVTQPTRVTSTSSSILDLLLTSSPDLVSDVSYLPGLSDHYLLLIGLSLPSNKSRNKTKTIYDYAKANFTSINDGLKLFLDDFLIKSDQRSVNENWCLFKNKLHELTELHVPRRIITTNGRSPWFTRSLKRLGNKKKDGYIPRQSHRENLNIGQHSEVWLRSTKMR